MGAFTRTLDERTDHGPALSAVAIPDNNTLLKTAMTPSTIAALFGAMMILAVIPGPGVFAVVARSIASGFKHGLVTTAGIVVGDFVFILLAVYGLSAVAETMGHLFIIIKLLGACYLIWLGISLLRAKPETVELNPVVSHSLWSNFLTGLFITLGNPKAILFYISLFPAFIDLQHVSVWDTTIIMIVATLAVGGIMLAYAWLASRARNFFRSAESKRRLNQAAGSVMVGTGAVILAKS